MLMCGETVTLVKCDGEEYVTTVFEGVSWFDKTQIKLENTGMVYANAVKIRIPAETLTTDTLQPEVGDSVFRGTIPEGAALRTPKDLAAYHPRKVMAVGDNRRGRLPHVVVIGQ